MTPILSLSSGSNFVEARKNDPRYKDVFTFIDSYDLPNVDLSPYIAITVPNLIDQEFMYKHRDIIRNFLNEGKVLSFSGHLFREWIPGASNFLPRTIRTHHDYEVSVVTAHPIFEGVRTEDLTFNKGVAGFFARGHHPAPAGAEILLSLPGGEPVVYIDRQSTKGTIFVHSGNDLFGYGNPAQTSWKIGHQLVAWIREEHQRLQQTREALQA
ncbi:phosphate starvation-inducible protein PhoH [Paenibacillus thalictri]|uniref:Phosphate starvation-inducible protein PhoH n=1 Tax=Paenibacillus thalictri TaxID=2527873 RepID=A0A4Q9DQW7_9BACL|nr:phosphate starvation-inducible protein PhoH [Paenibacillus thalictri]TBL77294.1 phosphate starvation-inducible protein PhoH [Paenibacillus thalictri]